MNIQVKSGVNLSLVTTKKFKTITIVIRFRTKAASENVAKRCLLANLLETSSQKYTDKNQVEQELANMYGASYSVNVSRKGTEHIVSVALTVVNETYLPQNQPVFNQGVNFLEEMLLKPNVKSGLFDNETFAREKANIIDYIKSVAEDKQAYAALELQKLVFKDNVNQAIPSYGRIEELEKVENADIYQTYLDMLEKDCIDIIILGDIAEDSVQASLKKLSFRERATSETNFIYQTLPTDIADELSEVQEISQSRLNIGFTTQTYYGDRDYCALQVFNGLFGGFPHSKLFMNVREKESLAYTISSSVQPFNGLLTVQTGINYKDRDQVISMINQELTSLINGEFDQASLEKTKALLKNQFLLSEDSLAGIVEKVYIEQYYDYTNDWLAQLEEVTKEDIMDVAQKLKLKAIYFLEGAKVSD